MGWTTIRMTAEEWARLPSAARQAFAEMNREAELVDPAQGIGASQKAEAEYMQTTPEGFNL